MRRVSSPVCGAISSATAAPVNAPRTNAEITVAAPPSSLAIAAPLKNTDAHVEKLPRILANVGDQLLQLVRGAIDVLIQLLVLQQPPGRPLTLFQRGDQLVDS